MSYLLMMYSVTVVATKLYLQRIRQIILKFKILSVFVIFIFLTSLIVYFYNINPVIEYDYSYPDLDLSNIIGKAYLEKENGHKLCPGHLKGVPIHVRNNSTPLIVIAGYPRSGSKIIKELIENYVNIECIKETHVIPEVLKLRANWGASTKEMLRLTEARVGEDVLHAAFGSFIRDIVFGQSTSTSGTLCIHESYAYNHGEYLSKIFPVTKFVFVVRDGREVIHSLMLKKASRPSEVFESYYDGFQEWSQQVNNLVNVCQTLLSNDHKCYILRIEDVFLQPIDSIKYLLRFLEIPLAEVNLSITENISKAFNQLSRRSILPQEALNQATSIASSLEMFGYDPKLYMSGNSAQSFETAV